MDGIPFAGHSSRILALAIALLSVAVAAPSSAQTVLTVDDDAGADYTRIADAVAAAGEGDVILVYAGTYGSEGTIQLGSIGLTITADTGATVSMTGAFQVNNLGAGKAIVLRGLDVKNFPFSRCLNAQNDQGLLWVEDCTFAGFGASIFDPPDPVVLTDCARVVFCACTTTGGTGVSIGPAGRGIYATRTNLFLEGTTAIGGEGAQDPNTLDGLEGGPGIEMVDGTLSAAEGQILGGPGGPGNVTGNCSNGGPGGVGVFLRGSAPSATLRNVVLQGGMGGQVSASGSCSPGDDGDPSRIDAGVLFEQAWPAHSVALPSPVRTDQLATVTFSGVPGELVWIGITGQPTAFLLQNLNGTLYLGPVIAISFVGALDASGTAVYQRQLPLQSGTLGDVLYSQGLFFDTTNAAFTLGTPTALVLLDPSL